MIHDQKPKSEKVVIKRNIGTGGAVSIKRNDGKWKTEKVKTNRYIPGKVPEFANVNEINSDTSSDEEIKTTKVPSAVPLTQISINPAERSKNTESILLNHASDPKINRLIKNKQLVENSIRRANLNVSDDENEYDFDGPLNSKVVDTVSNIQMDRNKLSRMLLDEQKKQLETKQNIHETKINDEDGLSSELESDTDEYTDSEGEEMARLKPVFVRKQDRLNVQQKEEIERQNELDKKMKKSAAKETKKRILNLVDKEITASEVADDNIGADIQSLILDLPSDDENSETYETEYQKWRIRELKRLKRDKLELQQMRMEKEQVQKLHEMNEEQRIAFFAKNPKMVSNHAEKGRYKFLQKYYHRGVFYLDKEDDIYKRNVDLATEDDNFDRSKLPKLMQVRNFGKANRTKYTHLVNEDTNDYLTPLKNNDLMKDMYMKRSGGVKQQFEKPSRRK